MDTMAPIRPAVRRARRISLTAGPAAAAKARRHVRAAIYAWDAPVDLAVAVLLTSELVTNAIRHEAGETVMLAITCACGQFRVDVHDTSCSVPVPVDAASGRRDRTGPDAGRQPVDRLGFLPDPGGQGRVLHARVRRLLDEDDDRSPRGDRSWSGES